MKQTKQRPTSAKRTAARLAALTVPLSLAALTAGPTPAPAGAKTSEFLIEDAGFTYSVNSSSLDFPRINDLGQVAAQVELGKTYVGGRTNANLTSITPFERLEGYPRVSVGDMNADGEVAGTSGGNGEDVATLFRTNGTEDLGFSGEGVNSRAFGINDDDTVVGEVSTFFGPPRAFIKPAGQPAVFPTPANDWEFGRAVDVANTGVALVNALPFEEQDQQAYRFSQGTMVPVGVIGGAEFSVGYAINDANVVTGESGGFPRSNPRPNRSSWPAMFRLPDSRGLQGGFIRAFRAAPGSAPQDLGVLSPNEFSVGHGINDGGDVVGRSGGRAFLFTDQRGLRDLNGLIPSGTGWQLETATGINSRSQIVGLGRLNQQLRVFRLTPRGNPVAPLRIGPGRIDFGRIGLGRYGQAVVTLRNPGTVPVSGFITSTGAPYLIRLPEKPGSDVQSATEGNPAGDFFVVGPGDVLRVRVYYVPRRRRTDRGFVIIETDPQTTPPGVEPRTRVRLSGRGC